MDEKEFLKLLENRVKEQEILLNQVPMLKVFRVISFWLGKHPWRILIPLSFLFTLFFRLIFGTRYYELILKIFGGFGIIK